MLRIYTDPTLTTPLSHRFRGQLEDQDSQVLRVRVTERLSTLTPGEFIYILDSKYNQLGLLRTLAIEHLDPELLAITVEDSTKYPVGSLIVGASVVEADELDGPGTNFPLSVRSLFIARSETGKRYKEILLTTSDTPVGVTVEFSKDGETWSQEIQLGSLSSNTDPYRQVQRRITVSRQEPIDLSGITYIIVAEEFLDYI